MTGQLASLQYQPLSDQILILIARIEILASTNLHLDIPEGILEFDLYIYIWSASTGLQLANYNFWCYNWNPYPYKPTFRHAWRHIGVLPLYLYQTILQYQSLAACSWPDIIFDMRIKILALTNLHLYIHEVILKFDLYICIWSASRWLNIIFDMRNEILTITNLHLYVHEHILVWPLYLYLAGLQDQPPADSTSYLQVPIFYINFQNQISKQKRYKFKYIILFWWGFYTWSRLRYLFFKLRLVHYEKKFAT